MTELTTGTLNLSEVPSASARSVCSSSQNSISRSDRAESDENATHKARSMQTHLSWTSGGGFKCARCSRPPKPVSAQDELQAMRRGVETALQHRGLTQMA